MANKIPRVHAREQDAKIRITNFDEVCCGYSAEEAVLEASRCLNCKNPRCVNDCPVYIDIPKFVSQIACNDFAASAETVAQYSSLPAVCGRVCPQETQCEGSCILGILFAIFLSDIFVIITYFIYIYSLPDVPDFYTLPDAARLRRNNCNRTYDNDEICCACYKKIQYKNHCKPQFHYG